MVMGGADDRHCVLVGGVDGLDAMPAVGVFGRRCYLRVVEEAGDVVVVVLHCGAAHTTLLTHRDGLRYVLVGCPFDILGCELFHREGPLNTL